MALKNIYNKFFPSKKKTKEGQLLQTNAITLAPVYRKRAMTEDARKTYVTELLDTYYGFGSSYLAGFIEQSITNKNIRREMIKIVRCLPLLKYFIDSISRTYATQPTRKFFKDGKEIIKTPKESQNGTFEEKLNSDKFIHDDELYETLNNLYNDEINTSIKQAEKFTNLLHTTVYKIVTNELGELRMIFLPSDTVQINPVNTDFSRAEQIAFIQDTVDTLSDNKVLVPLVENWTKDVKSVPVNKLDGEGNKLDNEESENEAAREYGKLFGTKEAGAAFAPFAVFRDVGSANDFWDLKDNDVVAYIKSINMSLTELKYLEKFTSFGLKYTVNIKEPEGGVLDPNGFINFAVANSPIPGSDSGKNFEIGEFKNAGHIDEVIKSIIFNLKMLFSIHNIPLDALISTNSVRSAENKQMENEELFNKINAQRDIWNNNEQILFKVMCAVHNRDNAAKIPEGVSLLVDFEESVTTKKTSEEWLVEIQNNVSSILDWISATNPDLDRDELISLFDSNKEINSKYEKDDLGFDQFNKISEAEDDEDEAEEDEENEQQE